MAEDPMTGRTLSYTGSALKLIAEGTAMHARTLRGSVAGVTQGAELGSYWLRDCNGLKYIRNLRA